MCFIVADWYQIQSSFVVADCHSWLLGHDLIYYKIILPIITPVILYLTSANKGFSRKDSFQQGASSMCALNLSTSPSSLCSTAWCMHAEQKSFKVRRFPWLIVWFNLMVFLIVKFCTSSALYYYFYITMYCDYNWPLINLILHICLSAMFHVLAIRIKTTNNAWFWAAKEENLRVDTKARVKLKVHLFTYLPVLRRLPLSYLSALFIKGGASVGGHQSPRLCSKLSEASFEGVM